MRFFYLRNEHGHPVACVASEKKPSGDVAFAVSAWNPKDEFSKARGRAIAQGRLQAGKTQTVAVCPQLKEFVVSLIAVSSPSVQARKAARLWLSRGCGTAWWLSMSGQVNKA